MPANTGLLAQDGSSVNQYSTQVKHVSCPQKTEFKYLIRLRDSLSDLAILQKNYCNQLQTKNSILFKLHTEKSI